MANDYSTSLLRVAGSPLAVHLGLESVSSTRDKATLRMAFAEHNVTVGNIVHGGAIAALADAAATAACWATDLITKDSRGTTIALNINFLNAALGSDLLAEAEVIQRGGSVCIAVVNICDDSGREIARATATYKLSHARKKD